MEERQPPKLSLVSDFSQAQYPYYIDRLLADPVQGALNIQAFRNAVRTAGIEEYKILSTTHNVTLYLKTFYDFERASVAAGPHSELSQKFIVADKNYDFRKLKNRRHRMQSFADKTHLRGSIFINLDRRERTVIVEANSKKAYLDFHALMTENNNLGIILKAGPA